LHLKAVLALLAGNVRKVLQKGLQQKGGHGIRVYRRRSPKSE
jgi:hypothetical protein